jgi:hypothetical protein
MRLGMLTEEDELTLAETDGRNESGLRMEEEEEDDLVAGERQKLIAAVDIGTKEVLFCLAL